MFDIKQFKNPNVKYRSIPFWSLNGKLKKEELKKQILNMKAMGFGGAFLHSRTGLETEYMSKEWMDLMEYCKDVLLENGMQVYLYDEDRYPSGTCGGLVTKEKAYKEKSMNYFEVTDFSSYKEPEECLGLFAVKLGKNKKCISYRKINNFIDAKKEENVYCFYVYYMPDDPFYNGNCMLDAMNIEATNKFIELTHEKYKERFGHLFGNDIIGIFTDEPCRGPMFTGFSHISPNSENLIPYTYKLFEEFEKRKGYKLEDNLPVLWFGLESDVFCKITYDYVEILEELFLENFAEPYSNWCKSNNLKFTGHILHEDNLAAQTNMSGSMMRFYEYFDYPGMDNLGPKDYRYNVPALVNSVCRQLGKGYLLDELYGVSGWPMKLEDYKRIGDWQSAGGVTLRVPHLCWYTMKGEAKRDCPASIFHQSSWYLDYRNVEDYFARLTYLLKEGKNVENIAIINPIESTWGLANQYAYAGFMCAQEETYAKIEKEYAELYKGLLLNGINCDYIDEGLFAKYGNVENESFICGNQEYKTIILNSNLNLRKTTLEAIKKFIAIGGKVIVVGELPLYLDGERHNFEVDLKGSIFVDFDPIKVSSMLKDNVIVSTSSNMIIEKRLFGKDLLVFALNRQDNDEQVTLKIKTNKRPVVLNLRSGEFENIEYETQNGEITINKYFANNEELCLYFSDELKIETMPCRIGDEILIDNKFNYKLLEDNFLVLHKCDLLFNDEFVCKNYSIYTDIELRKKLGIDIRGNQMLQPWFREKYHPELNKKYGVAKLHYEFVCDYIPSHLKMMFELQRNERIFINNKEINLSQLQESPIDCCFVQTSIDSGLFNKGLNSVDILFDYYYDTNIEDHYLMGDFAVYTNENLDTISKLPAYIFPGSINKQGFPYFGGKILLEQKIDNGSYQISTTKMGPAAINVNGKPLIFPPYKTQFEVRDNTLQIEMSFTRQNTFGIITVCNIIEGIKDQGFEPFEIHKIYENN